MDKSPDAFRTISEVADDVDLPQHVLRFWETRFAQIKPLKRGGGRRYYRPDDVDLLKGIRHLLYGQGYTIKGVQRILKEDGIRFVQSVGRGERSAGPPQAGPETDDEADDAFEADGEAAFAPEEQRASPAARTPPAEPAPAPPPQPAGPVLSAGDIERLKLALYELIECQRVLSALKVVDDPAGPDDRR